MVDPAQEFDKLCHVRWLDQGGRPYGPRLATISSSEEMKFSLVRRIATISIEHSRDPRITKVLRDVYFGFIDNRMLNALADVVGNQGYIAIFRGTVEILHDLFSRMLSHPENFSEIGTPSRESINAQHGEGLPEYFDEVIETRKLEGRAVATLEPIDPARRSFSYWLCAIAWQFLTRHELTHIIEGHCEYMAAKAGTRSEAPFILEASRAKTSPVGELTRQTIEIFADDEAAYQSFSYILQAMEFGITPPEQYLAPYHAMLAWHIAVQGIYYLWGLHIDPDRIAVFDYPPTLIRLIFAVEAARRCCRTHWPHLETQFDAAYFQSLVNFRNGVGRIGAEKPELSMLKLGLDQKVQRHIQTLVDRKVTLIPELKPYWSIVYTGPY